jgi:hypothetical protein
MPRERPREDDIRAISDRLEVGPVDPEARRRHRRTRLIRRSLLITALVIGLGGGALFVQLRSKTTVITVDESLARFREGVGASPAAVAGLPAPGVYVYATEGGDEITVLGGSHHTYPAETTVTVTPEGCGVRMRWSALGERWEEWLLCLDGPRLEIRSITTYHQFFGKSDHREYFCGDDSLYRPVTDAAGTAWTSRCAAADATGTGSGTVVGVEFLSVGGRRTRALHVEIRTSFEGSTLGTREQDLWMVADTGLPIILISRDDLETDSALGRTDYGEAYRMELRSLDPRT